MSVLDVKSSGISPKILVGISQVSASAEVEVVTSPAPIMEGEAKGSGDITLMNKYLAVAYSTFTTTPRVFCQGTFMNMALAGEKTRDIVAQFGFPLNDWCDRAKITEL